MADLVTMRDSVRAELERVLSSSVFEGAGRSRVLLKYVVEQTLTGRAEQLKEFTIGAEALGKGESFDPRTDPIVRAEASRLRSRLERYYAGEGDGDPVVITLPKGTYIPQFVERAEQAPQQVRPIEKTEKPSHSLGWPAYGLVLLVAVLAFAAGVFVRWSPGRTATKPIAQLDVVLTSAVEIGGEVGTSIVLSPDGTGVVFVASGLDGVPHLHLRRLDQPQESELPGTEGARVPFFSPDGAWVGFWAGGKVKKLNVEGGSPVVLCDAPDLLGASWGNDGRIIASFGGNQLLRFSASGGTPASVLKLADNVEKAVWPQIVRAGKIVVFTALSAAGANKSRVQTLSLDTGKLSVLISGGTFGRVVAGPWLTYVNQGTLYAVPFKADEDKVVDTPAPILNGVRIPPHSATPSWTSRKPATSSFANNPEKT